MAIVNTISNAYQFRNYFERAGRRYSFSYEGFEVLFNHLEQLSEGMGEDIEMDLVVIDSNYREITEDEFDEYGFKSIEEFEDVTTVLEVEPVKRWIIEIF